MPLSRSAEVRPLSTLARRAGAATATGGRRYSKLSGPATAGYLRQQHHVLQQQLELTAAGKATTDIERQLSRPQTGWEFLTGPPLRVKARNPPIVTPDEPYSYYWSMMIRLLKLLLRPDQRSYSVIGGKWR